MVGRSKGVIICNRFERLSTGIEDPFPAHPAVQAAAVVGLEDELRTLADHKVPDAVSFLGEFPMTGTGKVRRVESARLLEEARRSPST